MSFKMTEQQAIAMILTQQIKGHEPVTQVAILRTVSAQSKVGSYKHTLANAMLSQKLGQVLKLGYGSAAPGPSPADQQRLTAEKQRAAAAQKEKQDAREEEDGDKDVGQSDRTDTFTDYQPKNPDIASLGRGHPDSVVETTAMASVPAPKMNLSDTRLALPRALIEGGLLSALQLESIIYAKLRHSILLPDGSRSGFLLGDGAGIGKGRQIAGLIYEQFIRGQRRAIWFSASADLCKDAERDFGDIGAGKIPLCSLGKQGYGKLANSFPEGVLFCTYTCLISGRNGKSGKMSRFDQLAEWFCQGNAKFDGVMIFDECHKAK
eukprot:gene8440-29121_t